MSEVASLEKKSVLKSFSDIYGAEPDQMMAALKKTAFRQSGNNEVSNEQMMALLIVAKQHNLNPFTKEIYAFPDKGGIVPIVGVDGWARIINDHPQFDGMEFNQSDGAFKIDGDAQECHEWMECVIYRKDRSHPTTVREYLNEVYRPPFKKNDGYVVKGPWQTHTKRMLRHKVMIQCARIAFSFSGIYDPDEGERIIDAHVIDGEVIPQNTELQAAIARHQDTIDAIKEAIGQDNLYAAIEAWDELTNEEQISLWVAPTKGGPFTTQERSTIHSDEWGRIRRAANAAPDFAKQETEEQG